MKKRIVIYIFTFLLFAQNVIAQNSVNIYKNKFFSIAIPKNLKETYQIKIKKDTISIYHKESKKSGFGGFVFALRAYKDPAQHAMLPGGKKLGELTDKKGNLYDIVVKYPTDVQHDYTKNQAPPKSYKILANLAEKIDIKGVKGSTYFEKQGTKGKELYKDVLKKYKKNNIGYAYYDVNGDGIDELLIGDLYNKTTVYDIYTIVNRKPSHVINSDNLNKYYICNNVFVCKEHSDKINERELNVYILTENSTELFHQVSFKYDNNRNSKTPWFISYEANGYWDNVEEKKFKERISVFKRYKKFNFIP